MSYDLITISDLYEDLKIVKHQNAFFKGLYLFLKFRRYNLSIACIKIIINNYYDDIHEIAGYMRGIIDGTHSLNMQTLYTPEHDLYMNFMSYVRLYENAYAIYLLENPGITTKQKKYLKTHLTEGQTLGRIIRKKRASLIIYNNFNAMYDFITESIFIINIIMKDTQTKYNKLESIRSKFDKISENIISIEKRLKKVIYFFV